MSTKFSLTKTGSALKPASFWREKRDTVVILERGFAKMLRIKTSQQHGSSFGIFQSAKRPR